jgi:hypothetical protein
MNTPGTIVILSPEPWGKMLVSKMHYALELVKRGNKVIFVNPPGGWNGKSLAGLREKMEGGKLVIVDCKSVPGFLFLRHKLFFLFKLLNARYIRAIRRLAGGHVDQVWCFNPNVIVDLRPFRATRSILFLYDLYSGRHVWKATESADAIVTISQVILDRYKDARPKKLLMQHGLGQHFASRAEAKLASNVYSAVGDSKIKVGYIGNLLRVGMNTGIAKRVIEAHPGIEFHFWGPSSMQDNNVTSRDGLIIPELTAFIGFLQQQPNVFLHGVAGQQELAEKLPAMDMFLFLYSPRRELNGASNAHKLLEYLSTGKTVVSTHVSNYAGTGLLMMSDAAAEDDLPDLFDQAVEDLPHHNSAENQIRRIRFALENVYPRQVERILEFVS